MKPRFLIRRLGLLNLPLLLLLAAPAAAQSEGGVSGLVNLPGGGGHEAEFVVSNQMALHWLDGWMLVSTPGPQFAIAPGNVGPALFVENGSGHILKTRWTDIHGVDHEVQTFVPPTTNTELYIKRHSALVNQTLQWFPRGYNEPLAMTVPDKRAGQHTIRTDDPAMLDEMAPWVASKLPTSPPLLRGEARIVRVVADLVETHSPKDPTSKVPPLKLGDRRRIKELNKFDRASIGRRRDPDATPQEQQHFDLLHAMALQAGERVEKFLAQQDNRAMRERR